ncbi:MAG TPA: hypothetical protein DCM28_07625 [Phycisphaerales bacterium]|nr:hypothetical protein [Phycisphaerales bacterium]
MAAYDDRTPAYTFGPDTIAVFTFIVGGFLGLFWPFVFYALIAFMCTTGATAKSQSSNNADAIMAFINDLNQLGPLRYLIWAFAMAIGFVVTGFVSALVVFVCRHKWSG